jgi:hypothetical protein
VNFLAFYIIHVIGRIHFLQPLLLLVELLFVVLNGLPDCGRQQLEKVFLMMRALVVSGGHELAKQTYLIQKRIAKSIVTEIETAPRV